MIKQMNRDIGANDESGGTINLWSMDIHFTMPNTGVKPRHEVASAWRTVRPCDKPAEDQALGVLYRYLDQARDSICRYFISAVTS